MLHSEFLQCVNHFLQISDVINDGWVLKSYQDNVYLYKSLIQCLKVDNECSKDLEEFNDTHLDSVEDSQCADDSHVNFRKWEYHIIYSLSYQVPVIYFNVWNSNGQLLSLDELWKAIDPNFKEFVFENKWYTLTQREHPYLFKPFFYFHPCHTADFLNCFGNKKCNKLIMWLSSIGQVIWLKLNPLYGKQCLFE